MGPRKWRWIVVTSLSAVALMCGHRSGSGPIIEKGAGHSRSHHHHSSHGAGSAALRAPQPPVG